MHIRPRVGSFIVLVIAIVASGVAAKIVGPNSTAWGMRMTSLPISPDGMLIDGEMRHIYIVDQEHARIQLAVLAAPKGRLVETWRTGAAGGIIWVGNDGLGAVSQSGHIFVLASSSGSMLMLSRSGRLLLRIAVGEATFALAVDNRTQHVFVAAASGPDGTGTCGEGFVSTFDATSGRLLRTVPTAPTASANRKHTYCSFSLLNGPRAMALDTRAGRLFVVGRMDHAPSPSKRLVSVVDTKTGGLLQSAALGQGASEVAVDELTGRAFVAGAAGVTIFDTKSGRPLHTVSIQGASGLAVAMQQGRVFVTSTSHDDVYVLDAATGMRLHTVSFPFTPYAPTIIAVSDRQVFVDHGSLAPAMPGPPKGSISVLDGATGEISGHIALEGKPVAALADDKNRTLFVAVTVDRYGQNLNEQKSLPWWREWIGILPWCQQKRTSPIGSASEMAMIRLPSTTR